MPFAVELFFDTEAEKQICDAWEAIQKAGIGSSLLDAGYRPHVSLGVCNRINANAFEAELSSFAKSVATVSTDTLQRRYLSRNGRCRILGRNSHRPLVERTRGIS